MISFIVVGFPESLIVGKYTILINYYYALYNWLTYDNCCSKQRKALWHPIGPTRIRESNLDA